VQLDEQHGVVIGDFANAFGNAVDRRKFRVVGGGEEHDLFGRVNAQARAEGRPVLPFGPEELIGFDEAGHADGNEHIGGEPACMPRSGHKEHLRKILAPDDG